MESELRDLDRAAVRPYIEYPATPWWYPPFYGSFWAAVVASWTVHFESPLWRALILCCAVVFLAVFVGWYRGRWGVWPKMEAAPPEIRRAYVSCLGLLAAAGAVTVVVVVFGSPWLATALAFVAFTAAIALYERRIYPAACRQVRARLGL